MKPIPKTGSLKPAPGNKFAFIVAGDNRPANDKLPQPPTPSQIFEATKKEGVAFLVWTGDTIYGLDSANPDTIGKQYDEFFNLAATAGVPVFNAPGNHEMDVKVKHDKDLKEIGSAKMEKLYRKNMGIAKGGAIYGAFSYANARFILLNTEEIPPTGVTRSPMTIAGDTADAKGKVNLDPGYISPEQMKWVAAELAANKATHTFVFMHHPIKPKKSDMGLNKANADELVSLFAKYHNISYVFASHDHLYYNPQTGDTTAPPNRTAPSKDPPYYLISGGAGAPLAKGGSHNYLVVSVDGNSIKVRMVELP
jgi:3',5'-cyclic AMP phosphodiesterase CpdA